MGDARVAIITGASQGIGARLAGFRARGHCVVANSRSIGSSADDGVVTVAGDVADPAVADRIVATAVERFGRIDTLVANAGIFIAKPFTAYSLADFNAVMATNVAGFLHLAQRAAGHMLERAAGHIVTLTTSLVDQPMQPVPSALAALSKGGLGAVTRALAIEYGSTPSRPASSIPR